MRDKICAFLRLARTDAGLTQAQAAEAAGISGDAYQKIESGKNGLSMEYMRPLCAAFGVPLLSLLALCFDGIFPEPADAEYEAQVPVRVCDRERQEAALLEARAHAASHPDDGTAAYRLRLMESFGETELSKGAGAFTHTELFSREEYALLCLMAEAAGRDAQDAEVIRLAGQLAGMRRTALVKGRGKRV